MLDRSPHKPCGEIVFAADCSWTQHYTTYYAIPRSQLPNWGGYQTHRHGFTLVAMSWQPVNGSRVANAVTPSFRSRATRAASILPCICLGGSKGTGRLSCSVLLENQMPYHNRETYEHLVDTDCSIPQCRKARLTQSAPSESWGSELFQLSSDSNQQAPLSVSGEFLHSVSCRARYEPVRARNT